MTVLFYRHQCCAAGTQLSEFRRTVVELLGADGEPGVEGDYEAICRLERLVGAHKELTDLSRRLDEITAPSRPSR